MSIVTISHEQHREGTADGQNPVLAANHVDAAQVFARRACSREEEGF